MAAKKKGKSSLWGFAVSPILDISVSATKTAFDGGLKKLTEYADNTYGRVAETAKIVIADAAETATTFGKEMVADAAEVATMIGKEMVADATEMATTIEKVIHKTLNILITNNLVRKIAQAITALLPKTRSNTDTFKYKITKAKKNAINVGIFDANEQPVMKVELESTQGIAGDIKYNQWQYI